ncbi:MULTISPECIES: serine/threonine-protein kinase [Sorangium]|uniref:Protein kinase n=1 Tax=Sorangium cellulosum TaxID=56 RepID=A0A4P2QTD6_SORCE|nr:MULTISPECIES: serine/threonine-protein kinase [Sorangium]AUX32803.1 protein kinase [Sorangium cellulosum]WCQ92180.1 serine-threonine kinase [Sorangium sp. Soce836]
MSIDIVRGELERLFSLDEMMALSSDLLGFSPAEIGGNASKASFARALTDHCVEVDAIEALIDAVIASRAEVDARVRALGSQGISLPEELAPGEAFGDYIITRKIGEGPRGLVYAATRGTEPRTLKVLRREVTRDGRAVRRFLTHVRLAAQVHHESLASGVEAGLVGGRAFVAYTHVDGLPLSARLARSGPLHINEAKPLLRGILGGLAALHEQRVVHGALKLENVLVARGDEGQPLPVLIDVGGDRLGAGWSSPELVKTSSPEQLRGEGVGPASDLYAFGALLFELLTGKRVFSGAAAVDVAVAHLTEPPPAPSAVAPRGWVGKDIDELAAHLLAKAQDDRPRSARAALDAVEPLGKPQQKGAAIGDAELNDLIGRLVASPTDADLALAVEATVDRGADPGRVAEALVTASEQVDAAAGGDQAAAKRLLYYRAARIYEKGRLHDKAEAVYLRLLELDPGDDIAFSALEELRKALGKHEELVEMLLQRSERAESAGERARALNEIGHLYARELDDKDQGVFAFAQALAQDPEQDAYAVDLERAAGNDMKVWSEALQILSQASTDEAMAAEPKIALFNRLGPWYAEKIARADLGIPCFQFVLGLDPANEKALEGLAQVYRRAQQWQELVQVLLSRADRAPTPGEARDLRAAAAELLETKLNDAGRARDLYEQIFAEDPGHTKACDALLRIYRRVEDHAGYAKILERRAEALRGEERVDTMCRLAELYEDRLGDLGEATRRYEAALELDPTSLNALRGLDRIYSRAGRYQELLQNLERQIEVSATPRQKINLYERIAGIHDEEFLDHAKAAEALEAILRIDGAHEGSLAALGRHYRALERWEDVVALYERQLGIVPDDKRREELLLAVGRVLLEQVGSPERARKAYERVLAIDPHHAGALESLAHVRAATGDAAAALSAIESLAATAKTAESRADLWIRAAKMLEEKGDRDGAIERYKMALDAQPQNAGASSALRAAYLARGDATSAVELIAREAEVAEGNLTKARLYGEMALLLRERLKDDARAAEAATRAVDLDPTSAPGLMISGDLAFEAGRFLEAARHYELLSSRVDALPREQGLKLLFRYVDALSKSGSSGKAIGTVQALLALAPDDPAALSRAAKVNLDAGRAKEAAELYERLVARFGAGLPERERAEALLRLGEARLAAGDPDGAVAPLNDAADLAPESPAPLALLSRVFEAKGDWEEVARLKHRRLDVVTGEERSALLLEIGDLLATHLHDRTRAAKSYVAALDERPDDRKILTKLMQLYSEEKDWSKLIDIVLKLAAKIDDSRQKAKYLHTAAIVSARQLGDLDRAAQFYDEVLELDPSLTRALAEAIELRAEKGDHEEVERLLKVELDRATEENDTAKMLETFDRLGALYKDKLGWMSEAIDAYEAAQTLDPDSEERNELLANLYASNPAEYLDKAVAAQLPILRRSPYKPDAYRLLRKMYTETKRADAAFCLCQALCCLNAAEPDEERFFRRLRPDTAAAAQQPLDDEAWATALVHPDADPLLTAIFGVIEPAVLRKNGQPLEELGYQLAYQIDLSRHPYPMSQTLYYAAGVLGLEPPVTFQNPNDGGGVSFLHAHVPAIVLGAAALQMDLPTQAAAFIAARHLTYYRPGMYLRHLVPTGTGLRAWLFAAIKLISPTFPITKELEGPVKENLSVLDPTIVGPARDQLASIVTKLLQAGAIDLKRWVSGVDLTADRAGFLLANDLELAQEMIKAADEASAAVPQKERLKELMLYAVGEEYFAIRKRLGINVDS